MEKDQCLVMGEDEEKEMESLQERPDKEVKDLDTQLQRKEVII